MTPARARAATPAEVDNTVLGLRGRTIEVPGYTGPMDLLLRLIRKNEVEIYDIPIASITEQYLVELQEMERRDLTLAGDFLLMAASLLEIKSAMMLPRPPGLDAEEEGLDPRAELVERLLEYQTFQAVAEDLARLENQRRLVYSRPFNPAVVQAFAPQRPPLANLDPGRLLGSLKAVLARLEAEGEPITTINRQAVTLRMRIRETMGELALSGREGMALELLLHPERGRWFVIVSFLSLLELLRSGRIEARETPQGYWFWLTPVGVADLEPAVSSPFNGDDIRPA